MSVYIGDVQTFAGVIADKPQVLKVIEESAEVFSAWERLRVFDSDEVKGRLVEEIADTIQACANLLAAIGVDDMRQPMQVCYVRNVERGREYSSSGDSMDEQQDSIRTRPIVNGTCPIDEPQSVDANKGSWQELAENFRDMWQKADVRCSELKAENDGLKARIESLRSKLSKMLDAASAIQHIGDLP